MFNKLIVSEPEGADFKNRRSYFMVSSLVVGALFLTAVVISIYSADIGLGNDTLDITEILAPVESAADTPEPPKTHEPAASKQEQSRVPIRQEQIASVEQPTIAPNEISTAVSPYKSLPDGLFKVGPKDADPSGGGRPDAGSGTGLTPGPATPDVAENITVPAPPQIKPPAPVKPPPTQSLGVINGKATYLPSPPYPAAAKAVGLSGKVSVQVLVDENGKVVSANAVSGPMLLQSAAVKAALGARFTPTQLSNVPVKVTGVIIYNFAL